MHYDRLAIVRYYDYHTIYFLACIKNKKKLVILTAGLAKSRGIYTAASHET